MNVKTVASATYEDAYLFTPVPFDLVPIHRNPRSFSVYSRIQGFEEILESYRNANRELEQPAPFDYDEAARQFRAGADLAQLATAAADHMPRREAMHAAERSIVTAARRDHDSEFRRFHSAHKREIAQVILGELQAVITQVQEHLPTLEGINSIEEAIGDPNAAVAFSFLTKAADDFEAWHATTLDMLWELRSNVGETPGPEMFLAKREEAWPQFHRERTHTRNGSSMRSADHITLPSVPRPWDDTFDLVRDIAARDLELWVPARNEHAREQARLREVSQRLLDTDFDAAAQSRVGRMPSVTHH